MPDYRDRCEEHFCTDNNESIHLDRTVSSHVVNSQDSSSQIFIKNYVI